MKNRPKETVQFGVKRQFKTPWQAWFERKAPILRFSLKFWCFMALFNAFSFSPAYRRLVSAASVANAWTSNVILNGVGEASHVTEATLWAGKNAIITVLPACAALEYPGFLCAAILAFPAPLMRKIVGVLIGSATILTLNLLRTTSLYLIGVHFHPVFDLAHEEIWAALLVIAVISLLVVWIGWARRSRQIPCNAA